jgi:transcriptional regulator with XRE-family HTH domain
MTAPAGGGSETGQPVPAGAPEAAGEVEFLREVGRRALLLRQLRGMSQRRLASSVVGLTAGFVGAVESGRHAPGLVRLHRLAAALAVPLWVLLDGPTAPVRLAELAETSPLSPPSPAAGYAAAVGDEDDFLVLLGRRIRLLRHVGRLSSLAAFGDLTGLSCSTLQVVECGRSRLSALALYRIVVGLRQPMRTVVDGSLTASQLAPLFTFATRASGRLPRPPLDRNAATRPRERAAEAIQRHQLLLARRMTVLRTARGLACADLARAAGVDLRTLAAIEHARRSATVGTLRCLADVLSVPLVTLAHGIADAQLFSPVLRPVGPSGTDPCPACDPPLPGVLVSDCVGAATGALSALHRS